MASVYRVETTGKWRARVRRPSAPVQSKNFSTKVDAEAWARGVEAQVERGLWHPGSEAETTTLAAAIDKYAVRSHAGLLDKLEPSYLLRVPQSADARADAPRGLLKLAGRKIGKIDRAGLLKILADAPVLGVQVLDKPKEASILRQLQTDMLAKRSLATIHSSDVAAMRASGGRTPRNSPTVTVLSG